MNYRHIYMLVIERAKSQNRHKGDGNYYERHHILPKSLFPLWKKRKSNIVLLTAREHFFVHQLLTKIYPGREMSFALHAFVSRPNADYKVTSREYERIKKSFSKLQSERMSGREVSKETGELISKRRKEFLFDEDNLNKLKANFKKATKASAEARIKNTKQMMSAVPDLIKNETIDRLKEYDKLYGLTSTVYRQKKVECHCPECGETFTSGLKFFITEQRVDFVCVKCKNSKRMKEHNSSIESRHQRGLITDEEYNCYIIKRYYNKS